MTKKENPEYSEIMKEMEKVFNRLGNLAWSKIPEDEIQKLFPIYKEMEVFLRQRKES